MSMLEKLRPMDKPTVMELVAHAGLDTSDWQNYARGPAQASANPKYCYEWCFEQEGIFVLNIWFENMEFDGQIVFQRLNVRAYGENQGGPRKARAEKFEGTVGKAFKLGSNPRVIILDRQKRGEGRASARMLDKFPWTVTSYDISSGEIVLTRGIVPTNPPSEDEEMLAFPEGKLRSLFVSHRHREAKLRQQKIEDYGRKHGGHLPCEVPRFSFDFISVYGEKGRDFAHVHHLVPLSEADDEGVVNSIEDLAVICPNCHAMIHRGGHCRDMKDLISGV